MALILPLALARSRLLEAFCARQHSILRKIIAWGAPGRRSSWPPIHYLLPGIRSFGTRRYNGTAARPGGLITLVFGLRAMLDLIVGNAT